MCADEAEDECDVGEYGEGEGERARDNEKRWVRPILHDDTGRIVDDHPVASFRSMSPV